MPVSESPHLSSGATTSIAIAASSPQASAQQWFVTPRQRHCGEAAMPCRHRDHVYEQARQRHPRRPPKSQ
jgi:hypothetical protein